ncbi:uncharacterized protein LOC121376521 [Gigantopelta aegis]|uniref:uncharacterized protein LOC121376521 n=1 Tax=Gigantopelta aegis TaxID=1735272 RepID=UPI001B88AD32|nr:uncharacterized protein LOC121376521 [Gigantopelta aegis]
MCPPSKLLKNGYLLTPDQKGTEESFWKLVIENESYTIVTLSNETGKNLIPRPSQTLTYGKTTITALQQTSITNQITEKTLQIETKGDGEKRQIQHYSIDGWLPTTDSSTLTSCLTTIMEKIQSQQENVRIHPVTIVYRKSEAKNAITLCITNNIMTGMRLDTEVEIFNNVRIFQTVLPNVKFTKKDFIFFCNFAFMKLEDSSLYANCPSSSK